MRPWVPVLGLSFCATVASAQVTQVYSPDGWAGYSVEDFEDDTFTPGVAFSSETGVKRAAAFTYANGVTSSGVAGLTTNSIPDSVRISFDQPVSSVGLFFGNDDSKVTSAPIDVYMTIYAGDTVIDEISVRGTMNDYCDQFLGFSSNTRNVTSVKIRYGVKGISQLYTFIDDVYYNYSAVPLPSAAGAGLTGLGLLAMRRRRRS